MAPKTPGMGGADDPAILSLLARLKMILAN
jgi:hypothetical protein